MIKIKDKNTGEVWKILEKEDRDISGRIIVNYDFHVPLAGHQTKFFDSLASAMTWIAEQIDVRRKAEHAPKPRTFWNT